MAERSNATVSKAVNTKGSNPFLGIVSIKDVFSVANRPTHCGLEKQDLRYVATANSFVYQKLRDLQVQNKLKIVFSESTQFCCGTLDESRKTENGLYVGASSSGSVLDLLTGRCDVAITTDTGGSTVVPCSRARIFGFKPTYGRISRRGLLPLCSFLDTVSLASNSIELLVPVFDILDVQDPKDVTNFRRDEPIGKIKIAKNLFSTQDNQKLNKMFPYSTFEELKIPPLEVLDGYYYYCVCPELCSNLAKFTGLHHKNHKDLVNRYNDLDVVSLRTNNFNDEVKSRVMLGARLLLEYDPKPIEVFSNYLDRLLGPHMWVIPAAIGLFQNDPNKHITSYSVIANGTHRPCITFPNDLQNGLQVIGSKHSDRAMLEMVSRLDKYGRF